MSFKIKKSNLVGYTEEEGITEITVPLNVKIIGYCSFADCTTLVSIKIPNSVTKIGANAFYRCTSLTEITIPDTVKGVGEKVFDGCTSLSSVSIPEHLNDIQKRPEIYGLSDDVQILVRSSNDSATPEISSPATEPIPENSPTSKLPTKTELEMIFDYFRMSENEDARLYIEYYITKFMKFLIDNQNVDYITQITNHTDFLTLDNIDALLDYSIEKARNGGSFEIQFLLTSHKARLCGLLDTDKN